MPTFPVPDLRILPKAHLHLHLEGAMRPTTLHELAARDGRSVPSVQRTYGSFADFQALYEAAGGVLRSWDDLGRLVREVVEDAAADGAVWIEPAVHLPDLGALGPSEEVLEFLLDAGHVAHRATGVGVGWLLTADRTLPPDRAEHQAAIGARYASEGVVGFGLANDEAASPPELFARAFRIARDGGLLAAPHAGEHRGPESVAAALDVLGADRIQHGVRSHGHPELVERLVERGVCLDVCPSSNAALGVVPDLDRHPLPDLLAQGVRCSINADDPLLFGVGVLDELNHCRDVLRLDDAQLARCARASIRHSGAPPDVKEEAYAGIAAWLALG